MNVCCLLCTLYKNNFFNKQINYYLSFIYFYYLANKKVKMTVMAILVLN